MIVAPEPKWVVTEPAEGVRVVEIFQREAELPLKVATEMPHTFGGIRRSVLFFEWELSINIREGTPCARHRPGELVARVTVGHSRANERAIVDVQELEELDARLVRRELPDSAAEDER